MLSGVSADLERKIVSWVIKPHFARGFQLVAGIFTGLDHDLEYVCFSEALKALVIDYLWAWHVLPREEAATLLILFSNWSDAEEIMDVVQVLDGVFEANCSNEWMLTELLSYARLIIELSLDVTRKIGNFVKEILFRDHIQDTTVNCWH